MWTEILGMSAAVLTTLCWLPQTLKILKDKRTEGVSLSTNVVFAAGLALWLIYGLLIGSWPIVISNVITIGLVLAIIALKIRYS